MRITIEGSYSRVLLSSLDRDCHSRRSYLLKMSSDFIQLCCSGQDATQVLLLLLLKVLQFTESFLVVLQQSHETVLWCCSILIRLSGSITSYSDISSGVKTYSEVLSELCCFPDVHILDYDFTSYNN